MLTPEMKALRDWAMEKMESFQGLPCPVGLTDSEKEEWFLHWGTREDAFLEVIMKIDGSDEAAVSARQERSAEFYHATLQAAYRLRSEQEAQVA